MSHRSELIATLNAMVAERSLLKHPFYQEWSAGRLPSSACAIMRPSTIAMWRLFRAT